MNVGDFSSLLAAGQAGTVAVERISDTEGESNQRSMVMERLRESRQRAGRASGIGIVENEAQESTPDRDGDGRRWPGICPYPPGRRFDTNEPRSLDPTGQTGSVLDLMG